MDHPAMKVVHEQAQRKYTIEGPAEMIKTRCPHGIKTWPAHSARQDDSGEASAPQQPEQASPTKGGAWDDLASEAAEQGVRMSVRLRKNRFGGSRLSMLSLAGPIGTCRLWYRRLYMAATQDSRATLLNPEQIRPVLVEGVWDEKTQRWRTLLMDVAEEETKEIGTDDQTVPENVRPQDAEDDDCVFVGVSAPAALLPADDLTRCLPGEEELPDWSPMHSPQREEASENEARSRSPHRDEGDGQHSASAGQASAPRRARSPSRAPGEASAPGELQLEDFQEACSRASKRVSRTGWAGGFDPNAELQPADYITWLANASKRPQDSMLDPDYPQNIVWFVSTCLGRMHQAKLAMLVNCCLAWKWRKHLRIALVTFGEDEDLLELLKDLAFFREAGLLRVASGGSLGLTLAHEGDPSQTAGPQAVPTDDEDTAPRGWHVQPYWHASVCKNAAHMFALYAGSTVGETPYMLVNLDCDNLLTPEHISKCVHFMRTAREASAPSGTAAGPSMIWPFFRSNCVGGPGTTGRMGVLARDFLEMGGYDEEMAEPTGYQDVDLQNRWVKSQAALPHGQRLHVVCKHVRECGVALPQDRDRTTDRGPAKLTHLHPHFKRFKWGSMNNINSGLMKKRLLDGKLVRNKEVAGGQPVPTGARLGCWWVEVWPPGGQLPKLPQKRVPRWTTIVASAPAYPVRGSEASTSPESEAEARPFLAPPPMRVQLVKAPMALPTPGRVFGSIARLALRGSQASTDDIAVTIHAAGLGRLEAHGSRELRSWCVAQNSFMAYLLLACRR
jgi:hypothetical protein